MQDYYSRFKLGTPYSRHSVSKQLIIGKFHAMKRQS